ncbi:MAG: GAF domain-containing protein [Actinomycetota bacterium]
MREEGTLSDALRALAHELVEKLDADAAVISRVLGDVLIIVTQTTTDASLLSLGQGFLVSDYPPTRQVVDTREPRVLTLADDDVDPAEAEVLRALGFSTLLMLPFDLHGMRWGLVEIYRAELRPFTDAEIAAAIALARL